MDNKKIKQAIILFVGLLLMMYMINSVITVTPIKKFTISEFESWVDKGRIKEVVLKGNNVQFPIQEGEVKKVANVYYPPEFLKDLKPFLDQHGVVVGAKEEEEGFSFFTIMWMGIMGFFVWNILKQQKMMGGGGKGGPFGFGKSNAKLNQQVDVTFKDVAGLDEVEKEISEIVDFLKDPEKFTRVGGRVPKGILLVGPPGTGKTLLARALAGEAGVPFFFMSGSGFVEMFVGVGASRVRDLFNQGKKHGPSIIFIDELDAIGGHRGAGLGGGHDEKQQTLNEILVQMDGMEVNNSSIVIAATNRPDILDPALLRSGRFDRHVVVPLPDVNGREAILKIHTKKMPLSDDVDLKAIAKAIPLFSGADIEALANEAALGAGRRNDTVVTRDDFSNAKDKAVMGLENRRVMSPEEKEQIAYHEVGHAIVSHLDPLADPVEKITIIPRGGAAGATMYLPEERVIHRKDFLLSSLRSFYAGRAAEEVKYTGDKISDGAQNDIERATGLVVNMVKKWGMSDLGPRRFGKETENVFLGKQITDTSVDFSQEMAAKIDDAINKIVNDEYNAAKKTVEENIELIDKIVKVLIEKETIEREEFEAFFKA